MTQVLHKSEISLEGANMRRIFYCCLVLVVASLQFGQAWAQGYPGGGAGGMGPSTGGGGRAPHEESLPSAPVPEKADKAATKVYAAGMKSLAKARELEDTAAKATDPDKKGKALEKLADTYGRALDQFTEALRNKGDMYDAWNQVGFVHLRFGAYREAIDDYNHTLALKPDLYEAIAHRGQAYLGVDRLDEAKAAYMDLFFHARPMADELQVAMRQWTKSHQAEANGMRVSDIEAFDKWLAEREGIAKTAAVTN